MKKHLYLFLLLIISAIPNTRSYANSAVAGELVYEWISDSTYRFFFKYYRGCPGDTAPLTVPLCIKNTCNNTGAALTMIRFAGPYGAGSVNSGSLACSQLKTTCDSIGSIRPGIKEQWYTATYTLPSRCNAWKIFTTITNRIASNNILNATSNQLYVECTFNNTGSYQGNSSPYCSISPVPFAVAGMPFTYNNGTIDPNGDSLVTEIIMPRTGVLSCADNPVNVTFPTVSPALSTSVNPFQTNNTFALNANTGQSSFTPTQVGYNIVTYLIKEYRSGVLIGTKSRDICVYVFPNNPPATYTFTYDPNCNNTGTSSTANAVGCAGQKLEFCFNIKSSDTNGILRISDNRAFVIPGATITYSGQLSDSVSGKFSWTPGINEFGLKNLLITTVDSTCRPPGILLYSVFPISVFINQATKAPADTAICVGERANLYVTGAGNYTWTILAGGSSGSLSCSNCSNPVATPTTTTRYMVESQASAVCPNINKDTVQVIVYPALPPTVAYGDTVICIGEKAKLTATGAGNYQWIALNDSLGSLSCDRCPTAYAMPLITTRYIVTSMGNRCAGNTDTVDVQVYSIPPSYPSVSILSSSYNFVIKNYPVTFIARSTSCDTPNYQWVLNGNDVPGATNATWTTTFSTNAAVHCRMTCTDRCAINKVQYSNTVQLVVVTGIEEVTNNDGVNIYPNPTTGILNIVSDTEIEKTYNVQVINALGQSVYTYKNLQLGKNNVKQLDLSHLPAGLYTLRLNDNSYKITISKN